MMFTYGTFEKLLELSNSLNQSCIFFELSLSFSVISLANIDHITWCQVFCYCSKIFRPHYG